MRDGSLDNLLALDGIRMNCQGNFWVKFDIKIVEVSPERPHGIKYSLSLHDGSNKRIMGFDNAHAVQVSGGFKGKKYAYDHVHKHVSDPGTEYIFNTPDQLITDFWCEVDKVLAELET